jgi:glycosyltransferase involved in cell wall biosynthesis
MRIGLNLLFMIPTVVGGTEVYSAELIAALGRRLGSDDELVVFLNREAEHWPLPNLDRVIRVDCPVTASRRADRYQFEQVELPGLLKLHRVDVVHSLGYVGPLHTPCPSIVTVHDLNFAMIEGLPPTKRVALAFFVANSVRRATQIITVSEYSRQQIIRVLDVPASKVTAIHSASSIRKASLGAVDEFRSQFNIGARYLVAFGSRSRHKNLQQLFKAFRQAKRAQNLPHQLVVVGHLPLGETLDVNEDSIIATGYVSEQMKIAALTGAEAFVFPSVYEGFGLPLLEAMSCDTPVACSRAASLPEIAGDAALYFAPMSVEDMAARIEELLLDSSLRSTLVERGRVNLRRFSWDQAAESTLAVYEDVVARTARST